MHSSWEYSFMSLDRCTVGLKTSNSVVCRCNEPNAIRIFRAPYKKLQSVSGPTNRIWVECGAEVGLYST